MCAGGDAPPCSTGTCSRAALMRYRRQRWRWRATERRQPPAGGQPRGEHHDGAHVPACLFYFWIRRMLSDAMDEHHNQRLWRCVVYRRCAPRCGGGVWTSAGKKKGVCSRAPSSCFFCPMVKQEETYFRATSGNKGVLGRSFSCRTSSFTNWRISNTHTHVCV